MQTGLHTFSQSRCMIGRNLKKFLLNSSWFETRLESMITIFEFGITLRFMSVSKHDTNVVCSRIQSKLLPLPHGCESRTRIRLRIWFTLRPPSHYLFLVILPCYHIVISYHDWALVSTCSVWSIDQRPWSIGCVTVFFRWTWNVDYIWWPYRTSWCERRRRCGLLRCV